MEWLDLIWLKLCSREVMGEQDTNGVARPNEDRTKGFGKVMEGQTVNGVTRPSMAGPWAQGWCWEDGR